MIPIKGDLPIYLEPEQGVPVCAEYDVVVVGGGPAGVAAAVSAARNGASTVLVERYGHLGGMATGGLVILIPHLSDGGKIQQIRGINLEWINRLDDIGGALHPEMLELGRTDSDSLDKWSPYFSCVVGGQVRQSVYVEPESLKIVMSDMIQESGVTLALHSWGARSMMTDGRVSGVIFESKSGRLAFSGKVVIDCTGDGDIFASAGAEYEMDIGPNLRSSMMALVFRLGNVNFLEFAAWRKENPELWGSITKETSEMSGFRLLPFPSARNDVIWVNNWIPGMNCLDINDLTAVETKIRQVMPKLLSLYKSRIPGFEKAFLFDSASQIGTRGSRRLKGVYRISDEDLSLAASFDDTIAVFPSIAPVNGRPLIQFPYRALVPESVNGLLAAGRSFSSSIKANDMLNLIPHCAAMGEAAGCAAALAIDGGCEVRDIDIPTLREKLTKQGVNIPGVVA